MGFEVEQRRYPETRTTVVRAVGELSAGSVSLLRSAMRRAVREDSAVIIVDLGLTSGHDSAIVVPLVEAARLGRAFGAEVVVATPPGELASTLARCGLVDRRRQRPATIDLAAVEPARHRQGSARFGPS